MPAMTLPVGTIAMVMDPQGVPFYVMKPVPPPGQPDAISDVFSNTALQRVCWNELSSPDLAASKAFYAKHFGFEFNEVMPMGAMGELLLHRPGWQAPRRDHAAAGCAPAGAVAAVFPACPRVADAKRAIEANGGTVLHGPMQVPGGDWMVVATDPSNAPLVSWAQGVKHERQQQGDSVPLVRRHGGGSGAVLCAHVCPDSKVGKAHRAPGELPDGQAGSVLVVEFTVLGIPWHRSQWRTAVPADRGVLVPGGHR